jgi:hypothetical protein
VQTFLPSSDLAKYMQEYLDDASKTNSEPPAYYYKANMEMNISEFKTLDEIEEVDLERKVWVIVSEFSGPHRVIGHMIQNTVITTVWDTETGDALSMDVHSDDGMPKESDGGPIHSVF